MSLRDQLLAKGLVSEKKVREVNREMKKERRERQGHRDARQEIEARERAEREAAEAAAAEARRARRAEAEAVRAKAERALRIRNLILGNRVRLGTGPVHFHHRTLGDSGPRERPRAISLVRLSVTAPLARRLQKGEVAIAAYPSGSPADGEPESFRYEAISRQGALRLREVAPELLVHYVDPSAASREEADLALSPRDWEPTLGPRRATAADLARFAPVREG